MAVSAKGVERLGGLEGGIWSSLPEWVGLTQGPSLLLAANMAPTQKVQSRELPLAFSPLA